MRPYIDLILALLPFEPKAISALGGPETIFVGHPLIEQLDQLRPSADEALTRNDAVSPQVLLLPGSRRSEISRLLPLFGAVAGRLAAVYPQARFVLPTVPHLADTVRAVARTWPFPVQVVIDPAGKRAAFRMARVALAASGTVTLELALSGVPTVAAYRVGAVEAMVARRVVRVPSVILPNLILESRAVPEFLQQDATEGALFEAMAGLIPDGNARRAQLAAFAELDVLMRGQSGEMAANPSARAADAILALINSRNP